MSNAINRRSFLSGAVAVGALGALSLSGCAPESKAQKASTASGSNNEGEKKYLQEMPSAISSTKNYDIVVVGAGGAGMSAATRAAELGARVVLLEQKTITGGTTAFSEGLFAINSHLQKEAGKNPPDLGYDLFTNAMDYHHWYADGGLLRKFINASGGNISWMESVGIQFGGLFSMSGNEYNTWHLYVHEKDKTPGYLYCRQWEAAVKKAGADLVVDSQAVNILHSEEGVVTGIVAKEGRDYVQYNAEKGVILATGGYSNNPDMIKELSGINPDRVKPSGDDGRKGFGINASREAGGILAKSPGTMMFYGGYIEGAAFGTHLYCAAAFQPMFWVNQEGKRFVNEYYSERDFSFSGNSQSVQDRVISVLTKKQMDKFAAEGGIFGCAAYVRAGQPLTDLWDQYNEQVKRGNTSFHEAQTIEGLAQSLGIDEKTFVETVTRYNTFCAEKVDEDFGKDPQYLYALDEGPYYAFEMNVGIFTTVGGVKVNEYCQVLDKNKQAIRGLYAAGCDAGGLYGDAYDVGICEGSAQGFAVFSGKEAAEHIMGA